MKSKIKLFLIILNIILAILLIIQLTDNTLKLKDVKKEITNIFGNDYIITIHKISKGQFVVLASIPEELYREMDNSDKLSQLKDSFSKYKIDLDKINKITLLVGYHTQDTKYIKSTTEIDLSKLAINNYK